VIGRYIDALAEAGEWDAIDRVLLAQSWTTGVYLDHASNAACLIGHIQGGEFRGLYAKMENTAVTLADELISGLNGKWSMEGYFDLLCGRFGMDRVVSAIKARCGRHSTRPSIPTASPVEHAECR
jgi:hypothetical protein